MNRGEIVKIAKLDNGELVEYDTCSSNLTADHDSYKKLSHFIGAGVIWKINGVKQIGIKRYGFWKYKTS